MDDPLTFPLESKFHFYLILKTFNQTKGNTVEKNSDFETIREGI